MPKIIASGLSADVPHVRNRFWNFWGSRENRKLDPGKKVYEIDTLPQSCNLTVSAPQQRFRSEQRAVDGCLQVGFRNQAVETLDLLPGFVEDQGNG